MAEPRNHKKYLPHGAAFALFLLAHLGDVSGFTAPLEGEIHKAYLDSGHVATICDGHTGHDVHLGMVASHPECMRYLAADEMKAARAVGLAITVDDVPYTMWIAESDMAFNMGVAAFLRSSVLQLTNADRLRAACEKILDFNKITVTGSHYDHRDLIAAEYKKYRADPAHYDPPGRHKVAITGLDNRRNKERSACLKDL